MIPLLCPSISIFCCCGLAPIGMVVLYEWVAVFFPPGGYRRQLVGTGGLILAGNGRLNHCRENQSVV